MKSDYPPIKGNPRRDKEAPTDAGIQLRRPGSSKPRSTAGTRQGPKKRRPDKRLKVTVKNRELLEQMSEYFGLSMSSVMNMGLAALAEKHGFV